MIIIDDIEIEYIFEKRCGDIDNIGYVDNNNGYMPMEYKIYINHEEYLHIINSVNKISTEKYMPFVASQFKKDYYIVDKENEQYIRTANAFISKVCEDYCIIVSDYAFYKHSYKTHSDIIRYLRKKKIKLFLEHIGE